MIPYDMVFEKDGIVTRYKGDEKSWIDHVIGKKSSVNIKKVRVMNDDRTMVDSTSDHLPLVSLIRIKVDLNHQNKRLNFRTLIDKNSIRCRWNLMRFKDLFASEFKKYENDIIFWIDKLDNIKTKEEALDVINEVYIFIHKSLNEAAESTSKEINKLVLNNIIKIESWWTPELKHLNSETRRLYALHKRLKVDKYKIQADIVQKRFRLLHRIELSKHEFQNRVKLDRLKDMNINKFWKKIKNKLQKKCKVQVNIDILKNEFGKIFNEKLIKSDDTQCKVKVDKFTQDNKDKIFIETTIKDETIEMVIKDLNNNKAIGNKKASNEMFKNTRSKNFINLLAKFFTVTIQYGVLPNDFNVSIIKPLVKDSKKATDDQNNIRPISVSDTISTIFEKLLLLEINKMHVNNNKQFGFKSNSSCQHGLFVFNEALNSNKRRNKKTYVCAIDASKAFDKVNRTKLWAKLIDKISPNILRILMNYYSNSLAYVINDEDVSDLFKTTIGVKQGGCLSPRLFTIYVEDVIELIEDLNYGIPIGKLKIDIILYADDILLITDEKYKLSKMLNIMTKYGFDNEIKFNGSKTTLMVFNKTMGENDKISKMRDSMIQLTLANEQIIQSNGMKYLGCYFSDNYSWNKYMSMKEANVAVKISQLEKVGLNDQGLTPSTKAHLFNSFIRPIVNYGIDTMSLTGNDIKRVKELEGNSLKDSLGLFRRIFSTSLFKALGLESTINIIRRNKITLFQRLLSNDSTCRLIREIMEESKYKLIENSILNDVNELITLEDNLIDVNNNCDVFLNEIKKEHKNRLNDPVIAELSMLLNKRFIDKNEIESLLSSYDKAETNFQTILNETDIFF